MGITASGICVEHREELAERLKRTQGQVGGILQMVLDKRKCLDVLNQLAAARAALAKAGAIVIEHHIRAKLSGRAASSDEVADELKALIHKLLQ